MSKFSTSTDGEAYYDEYPTELEALEEAFAHEYDQVVWVGECEPPEQPEHFWDASNWLEHVSCQDEYSGEYADYWDRSTPDQRKELEREVSKVMAAWLDRHDLRPKFFSIKNPKRVTREQFKEMKQKEPA